MFSRCSVSAPSAFLRFSMLSLLLRLQVSFQVWSQAGRGQKKVQRPVGHTVSVIITQLCTKSRSSHN